MQKITRRYELVALARELGVRQDWHEPDEQDLTARVYGRSFDNAGFWPTEAHPEMWEGAQEMHVVLCRREIDAHGIEVATEPIAAVNLATLFAWATGHEHDDPDVIENSQKIIAGIQSGAFYEAADRLRDLGDERKKQASR